MRFKPTLILLVITIIALGYFFRVEQPRHRRQQDKAISEHRLTEIKAEDIGAATLVRPDATLVFFSRDGTWRMSKPTEDRADQASVNTLVRTVVDAQIHSQFAAEQDQLADYGLENPAATLRLGDDARDDLLVIEIGDFNLTKTHCYARERASANVLLLPAGLRRYAVRSVFEFRDKKVTDIDVDDVVTLSVASGQQQLTWHRASDDQWVSYQSADTIRGDKSSVEAILRELRALRAKDLLDDGPADMERLFTSPAGEISLWLRSDSMKVAFLFSQRDSSGCFVKVDAKRRIELVDATALDVFDRSLADLRDRKLLHFARDRLARVALEAEGLSISIVKSGTTWSFANPTFGAIDPAAMRTFLNELESLKYRTIIEETLSDPRAYGLDPPSYRLMLYDDDGHMIDQLTSGATRPGPRLRYATSLSSRHMGTIDAEPLEEIRSMFEDFRLQ